MIKSRTEVIHSKSWNKNRLNAILSHCRDKKILVIGDVGIDRYTIGSVERVSPEAPVPVVCVEQEVLKLGLAANVADNIHALGGKAFLMGVIGRDRHAKDFRELLKISKISSRSIVVDPKRKTSLKERVVSEKQQLLRIDYESRDPLGHQVQSVLLKKIASLIQESDGVIIEDYAKGMLTQTLLSSIFRLVQRSKKLVAVDPNAKTSVHHYKGATLLTPNTKELEALCGFSVSDDRSFIRAGWLVLKWTSAKFLVVTRGKDGIALFSKGSSKVQFIPTYAREVYDVSGAGDTVISVLVLALLSEATLIEAAVLGNLAGGIEVSKRGTATVSPSEIRAALDFFENAEF